MKKKTVFSSVWSILLVVAFLLVLVTVTFADDDEIKFNWQKEWETSIGAGYKNYTGHIGLDKAGTVLLRAQKRVGYPLLLGIEEEVSLAKNVAMFRTGVPFTYRVSGPGDRLKIDLSISPSVVYATNLDTDVKQLGASGMAGVEVKYFYKSGYSLGLGAYYTATTNKLSNYSLMLMIGF